MPGKKSPTPQELYRARKQREEQEKVALLPPGLVNHGNTCFMNSVLQGLIATKLLSDLAHFEPISEEAQKHSTIIIASHRSPLLTNGHGVAGQYEQPWIDSMQLGDIFLSVMHRAWHAQGYRKRESLSPKPILGILGRKYEQYLDFAQQDAHEFLCILLDSMRMEEMDVIKKRQPPPPSDSQRKKRRRTTITPASFSQSSEPTLLSTSAAPTPEEEKLIPMVDMVFGGKLTSVLVCQKCKHVSQTYEDFNDLSLSIKAEDYVKERKRDRLKTLAKKLRSFNPSTPTSTPTTLTTNFPSPRASSVPPSPHPRESQSQSDLSAPSDEPRRRSFDFSEQSAAESGDIEGGDVRPNGNLSPPEDKRLEFLEPKPEKKEKGKDWAKIGRRISLTVGLGKPSKESKERKSRSTERRSRDFGSNPISDPVLNISASASSTPRASISDIGRESAQASTSSSLERLPLDDPPRRPISLQRPQPASTSSIPLFPHMHRSKSPKPPKPSAAETAYLRRILADVDPSSAHNNPFSIFIPGQHTTNASGAASHSYQPQWFKPVGKVNGIEECLRLFTAVEVLDNENMVGCRRCWKIEHGEYHRPPSPENDEDDDDESLDHEQSGHDEKSSRPLSYSAPATPSEGVSLPTSQSTPSISTYSNSNLSDDGSEVSLRTFATSVSDTAVNGGKSVAPPLTVQTNGFALETQLEEAMASNPGGLPIPSISTAPPSPDEIKTSRPDGIFPTQADPYPPSQQADTPYSDTQPSSSSSHVHISESNGSLLAAPQNTRHRPKSDAETDSSGESDASAGTSAQSSASDANGSRQANLSSKVKVKSKPKPVIMRPAYKRYLISTPPPVLVIHLKRFQQISKSVISFSSGFKKLDDYVAFPEYLDLTPFLAPKKEDFGLGKKATKTKPRTKEGERCMYRLYAVVVHIGSMLGGHYIAYSALPQVPGSQSDSPSEGKTHESSTERQWAYISDTIVRLTTKEEVLKAKAYLCMYERI